MLQPSVLAVALVLVLGGTAVAAGRAAARGRQPWLPLVVVWLGVALSLSVVRPELTIQSAVSVLVPLAPLGVTALATNLEVRRGCSLRRAGSVAVLPGSTVAAVTPLLVSSLSRLLCAATDCL